MHARGIVGMRDAELCLGTNSLPALAEIFFHGEVLHKYLALSSLVYWGGGVSGTQREILAKEYKNL